MNNHAIEFKDKASNNPFIYRLGQWLALVFFAILIFFIIVIVKSKTLPAFSSSPIIVAYTLFVNCFILYRLTATSFYKYSFSKIAPEDDKSIYEPDVSFVIPCKNEEKIIKETIERCFNIDYPQNKFEVIAINDGSTDNTAQIIESLRYKFNRLIIINFEKNKGKRHAMAEGFRRATGEIVVQLDSDSYIEAKTFKNLIKPFQNSAIGAVCAHTDPENANENFLTKMQAAYYFMSFRILKAAESTFLNVFCCSGCSSAYRKSIVLPILDNWVNEKFLNLPATWGDDRALTTWVLKSDYKTIYTDKVRAYTIVPNNLKQLVIQQLRWKKSWIINSVFVSRFLYRKQPFIAFSYFFPLVIISFLTPLVSFRALVYSPIFRGVAPWSYIIGITLVTTVIILFYRFIDRKNKYWLYLYAWAFFNLFFLTYLIFYAVIRLQDRRWGTR